MSCMADGEGLEGAGKGRREEGWGEDGGGLFGHLSARMDGR